jgi:uncharacterized repeat protein (TIGR03803 family)
VYKLHPITLDHSVVKVLPGPGVYLRSRLWVASDGDLYGSDQGRNRTPNRGTVFRVDPLTREFTSLKTFAVAANGWEPRHLTVAPDGTLYGTTRFGGEAGLGTAFRIEPNGLVSTIHSFEDVFADWLSENSRLTWATDDTLYGTRERGGVEGAGALFRMTPDGERTDLFEFESIYAGEHGLRPFAPLIEASDGDLYGTTHLGGYNRWGTIFRITKGGTLDTLVYLNGTTTGSEPVGRLVEGSDGRLYGTALLNGSVFQAPYKLGTVFRLQRDGTEFRVLHQFVGFTPNASRPWAGLTETVPEQFLGTASRGGVFDGGVLFKLTVSSSEPPAVSYEEVWHFGDTLNQDGVDPIAELTAAGDGFLYGTTLAGGLSHNGTVYRIRPDGTDYELIHRFAGADGSRADVLVAAPDGNLYGITRSGGPAGGGVVFRVRLTPLCEAGGPYTVPEGGSVELSATCNRDATFEWDLDDDGTFETPGQTVTFGPPDLDGDEERTVRVRATDVSGLSAEAGAVVNVTNVAPVVDAGPDVSLIVNETLVRSGSFADPGPDTWTATVGYGDGPAQPLALVGKSFTLGHQYSSAGVFTVEVTVTDDDGGAGTDGFQVTVETVENSILDLIGDIEDLVAAGLLNKGQGNSFISKLEAALQQLAKGNVTAALNQLQAFVNEVTAYIDSGKLPPEEGQPLIDKANRVIAVLS